MKIISIWGGPGSGKSTTAAGVFHKMKKSRVQVELVTEYAKDLVWENRQNILDDQLYVLAKQNRRISRLVDHGIDWVITDSPLPLGLVYLKPGALGDHFPPLVMELFNKYDNYNFLLNRGFEYYPVGRNQQDLETAVEFDNKVKSLLDEWHVPFTEMLGDENAVDNILKHIGAK